MTNLQTKNKYGLYIDGKEFHTTEYMNVLNKYSQETIAQVSIADQLLTDQAVKGAKEALTNSIPPYRRYEILTEVARLLKLHQERFADLLVKEVGKPITEAKGEVGRAALTLEISAEETKRINGQGVPIEAAPDSEKRRSYTIRKPVGVIAAITPFNVPLNLVCHKIGPALASGNSVILKPSDITPLVALELVKLFEEAGLPKGKLQVLTGDGASIGEWLLQNEEIDMFTFTGSEKVGAYIRKHAGLRKVVLELGNNSATIVHHDADINTAAKATAMKSFNNAGQVCISVQRVYVHESIYDVFINKMIETTNNIVMGDPSKAETDIGPMISEEAAKRIENWVSEAESQGAVKVTGGSRQGVMYEPTILKNVTEEMKVSKEEAFGPIVAIQTYQTEEEVIQKVNNSSYGLQAGLFTNNLRFAFQAIEDIEVGGLIINDTPGYRVDHMPYGGIKKSGSGKEGPKYAIKEMTEEKLIVWNQ